MAIETDGSIRFMNANLLNTTYHSRTFSSEVTGNEFTNALTKDLENTWKLEGSFVIDSTNNKVYINDGSNKTVTINSGTYTGSALATEIQTRLNADSSGWTVTYTGAYFFDVTRSSSATWRLEQTSNAVWETIGHVSGVNAVGTSFVADEQRNHYPDEFVKIDLGFQAQIDFFGLIYKTDQEFTLSNSAIVRIQASNIDSFDSTPLDVTARVSDFGAFSIFNDVDASYRYWRISINDMFNPNGPELEFSYLYLGQAETFTANNVEQGFNFELMDRSKTAEAESGKQYFDIRQKGHAVANLKALLIKPESKNMLLNLFREVGITEPFFVSIDPKVQVTEAIEDLTKFVYFNGPPKFTHIFCDNWAADFALKEAF